MIDIFIPSYCKKVINLLQNCGFEAYIVGGCVRDSLMGKTPNDYDVTTNATPQEMLECFKGQRVVETGLKHGTVTVVIDNQNIEVTTYRIDGEYQDNRHPKSVNFTKNLKEDLKRRDFTVNALAFNEKSGLVDLFDGEKDIKKGIIKCVGEPDKRFSEDGLRILRALRFSSVLGFEIDEETAKSIHKNKNLLKNISVERIFVEFKKLLCGQNAENVLLNFKDVIAVFIPETTPCFDFDQHTKYHCYDVYTHIIKTVSSIAPEEKLRLSAFFHDIGKPQVYFTDENGVGHFYGHNKTSKKITRDILERLKCDNETKNFVLEMVYYHDVEVVTTEKAVKRFLNKTSPEFFRQLIEIKRADAAAHAPQYRNREEYLNALLSILEKIENEKQCFSLKDLDLNGSDLIENGFAEGEQIGKVLNYALESVINGEVKNKKDELIKLVIEKKEII